MHICVLHVKCAHIHITRKKKVLLKYVNDRAYMRKHKCAHRNVLAYYIVFFKLSFFLCCAYMHNHNCAYLWCAYMHNFVCAHIHLCLYIHACFWLCTHIHISICAHTYFCLFTHIYVCIHMHIFVCAQMHNYVCANTHNSVCTYMLAKVFQFPLYMTHEALWTYGLLLFFLVKSIMMFPSTRWCYWCYYINF